MLSCSILEKIQFGSNIHTKAWRLKLNCIYAFAFQQILSKKHEAGLLLEVWKTLRLY